VSPELSRRLGEALGTKYTTPAEQGTIRAAADDAETWDDLSADVQSLVEAIEARPDPWSTDDPTLDQIRAMAEPDDEEIDRAAGHDVTPGHDELHHYWTVGPGRHEWVNSPTPWRTLLALLVAHVKPPKPLEVLKKWASRWFIEVKDYAAGSDENRVAHGHPPRGHRVGPG
jgi:hypothetical protein